MIAVVIFRDFWAVKQQRIFLGGVARESADLGAPDRERHRYGHFHHQMKAVLHFDDAQI
jgi:hypothetical protein